MLNRMLNQSWPFRVHALSEVLYIFFSNRTASLLLLNYTVIYWEQKQLTFNIVISIRESVNYCVLITVVLQHCIYENGLIS